jgi:hypothetical protein
MELKYFQDTAKFKQYRTRIYNKMKEKKYNEHRRRMDTY